MSPTRILAAFVVVSALATPSLAAEDAAALRQRFDYLSTNGNSNCSFEFLQAIPSMAPGERLRGSCCSPMDFDHYVRQTDGLRAYTAIPEIPSDPYDIEAGSAARLIAANAVVLTADEQAVFDEALALAEEGGPCCCRCWRWDIYSGLAKQMIRDRGFTAEQIAAMWDLSSGCGS